MKKYYGWPAKFLKLSLVCFALWGMSAYALSPAEISMNNLMQYTQDLKPGDVPMVVRPGVSGPLGVKGTNIVTSTQLATKADVTGSNIGTNAPTFRTAIGAWGTNDILYSITNPVVATVAEGAESNVIAGAAVKDALAGIEQKTEIATTNLSKLHVVEYPQQSNGESASGGIPTFYPTNYLTTIPKSFANIWKYTSATSSVSYIGTNRIFSSSWGAEVGSALAVDDLINVEEYYYTRLMRGGQPLDTFIKGTAMYTQLLTHVALSTSTWANAGTPDVVIWGQNESGSTAGTYADYYSKATNLIANMRADLGNPNLRFVFQGRNAYSWDSNWTNYVDQAMMQICKEDPLCTYMSERQFETPTNDVHYTKLGQAGRGRATGGAVFGILRGLDFVKGFRTMEAWVDRFSATVGNFGELRAGNAEIDGRLKAGEADIDGVVIENGNITTSGSIVGNVVSTTPAIPTDYVSLYAPFRKGSLVDPVTSITLTNVNTVSIAYDSTERGTAADFTVAGGSSNWITFANQTLSTNWTISFWVKELNSTASYSVLGRDGNSSTFSLELNSTGGSIAWRYRDTGTTSVTYTVFFGNVFSGGGALWDDGNWHNIIVTQAGTNYEAYADGSASLGAHAITGVAGSANRSQCIFNSIGRGLVNQYNYCGATLDDVLILNGYAVTATEAAAIYNRQKYGDSNIQGNR